MQGFAVNTGTYKISDIVLHFIEVQCCGIEAKLIFLELRTFACCDCLMLNVLHFRIDADFALRFLYDHGSWTWRLINGILIGKQRVVFLTQAEWIWINCGLQISRHEERLIWEIWKLF